MWDKMGYHSNHTKLVGLLGNKREKFLHFSFIETIFFKYFLRMEWSLCRKFNFIERKHSFSRFLIC